MAKAYQHTTVLIGESKGHIIAVIAKYGGRLHNIDESVAGRVIITFQSNHAQPRHLRILLGLPVGNSHAVEQTCRRKWRALYNYVKNAFVAVDEGIMLFDQAFLAWIVGNDGMTLYEKAQELHLLPALADGEDQYRWRASADAR